MKQDSFDINKIVRKNIKALKPYSSARDEFKEASANLIFLDANENPFENGVNRYPDPQQTTVKEILAEQKSVGLENILIGNGSDEVLDLLFRAFCEPNQDRVITLPPTYGMYQVLADINAVATIKVPLDNNFEPKVTEILANNEAKLLFLCSPNNPTANSFSSDKIMTLLKEFKGLVVIDEAYIDFSKEESWVSQIAKFPNLIVTQTLSKAYGLAGIRMGICYASAEIIEVLNRIKPPYNVNGLSQQRALARLSDTASVKEEIETLLIERERLGRALKEVSFVNKVYTSDTNFILFEVDDANQRYDQILAAGIVARNRTNQTGCTNCLRITVGTPKENQIVIKTLTNLK